MSAKEIACQSRKLPRWMKISGSAAGLLLAAIGMSRVISGGDMRHTFLPIAVGGFMMYISGFEKTLWIDDAGVARQTSFWGQKKTDKIPWKDIYDARIILNKGEKIYVIMHGLRPLWPMIFTREQQHGVVELIRAHLPEEDIKLES